LTTVDRAHYEQTTLWGRANVALPDHQDQRLAAIDRLVPNEATTIVDVGAGDGRVLHHLSTVRGPGLLTTAVERSFAGLEHVGGALRVQGSIDAVPIARRAAHTVLCCEVLEHLPNEVYRRGIKELARIADRSIVITVPNNEVRRRADVTCASCGCRYNRERHLRSFGIGDLDGLVPGFDLSKVIEAGPRQPLYPRFLRVQMERVGLLPVLGSPSCPQCGETYLAGRGDDRHGGGGRAGNRYRALRSAVPKQRRPYWLCARFTRSRLN
jgi:hypothetical protein